MFAEIDTYGKVGPNPRWGLSPGIYGSTAMHGWNIKKDTAMWEKVWSSSGRRQYLCVALHTGGTLQEGIHNGIKPEHVAGSWSANNIGVERAVVRADRRDF